jgi:hypothetical protein
VNRFLFLSLSFYFSFILLLSSILLLPLRSGVFLAAEWVSNNGFVLEMFPIETKHRMFLSLTDNREEVRRPRCWSDRSEKPEVLGAKVVVSEQQVYLQIPKLGNHILTHCHEVPLTQKGSHVDIFAPYRRLSVKWDDIQQYWSSMLSPTYLSSKHQFAL